MVVVFTLYLSARLNEQGKANLMATERRRRRRSAAMGSVRMKKIGSYRQVTETWKGLVREVLDGRGRGSRSALAKKLGCASSAITQLLAPGTSLGTSRIASAVDDDTGVPLPDDVDQGLSEVMYEVSREQIRRLARDSQTR